MNYTFQVNSFTINAQYHEEDIKNIFIPLIQELSKLQRDEQRRLIVFLAAPPGSGKTTLSLMLEHLSAHMEGAVPITAVGLDGFHYPQEYLEHHQVYSGGKAIPMKTVKGCPETFDIEKTADKIKRLRVSDTTWPVYDRTIHDVVEAAVFIDEKIVLIEGNWLLLDEPRWRDLKKLSDYSIFIQAEEDILKARLIQRKIAGGLSLEQAEEFYNQSDVKNVYRVLNKRLSSNLTMRLLINGKYEKVTVI